MSYKKIERSEWQQKFIDSFMISKNQRNVLLANTGTGKTGTVLQATSETLRVGKFKKIVIFSDRTILREQWRHVAKKNEMNLVIEPSQIHKSSSDGVSLTYQSLIDEDKHKFLREQASNGGLLIIIDQVEQYKKKATGICDELLGQNKTNQCLFISRHPLIGQSLSLDYDFGREFLVDPKLIHSYEMKIQIVKHAPSLSVLDKFKKSCSCLDELGWRQFEILIRDLLESDGYEIELMSGTKDGGVDIIAIKDLGESGKFKALWQAKRYKVSNKVGISAIRELADVRNECKANKGLIVTSSFFTAGALKRIERDKFILGKVDRNDLIKWINRKLYE